MLDVLAVVTILLGTTICCFFKIKSFLDYDRDNRVPDDIEEVVSRRIFKIQEAFLNAEYQSSHFQHEGLRRFVTGAVIPKAEGQRSSSQFAVLVLQTKSERDNPLTFQFKPSNNGRLPINSNESFIPARSQFNNYIVARPERGLLGRYAEYYRLSATKHAEKILLDEFEDLLLAYGRENKEDLDGIFLYSWIMPCTECITKIIDSLASRQLQITVAYTHRHRYDVESEKKQETNRARLRHAGVAIEQIPYKKHLRKKSC